MNHSFKQGLSKVFLMLGISLVVLTACAQTGAAPGTAEPTAISPTMAVPATASPAGQSSATSAPSPTKINGEPTVMPTAPTPTRNPVWKELVSGLKKPTDLSEIPDGSGLLAVLEQAGTIRLMKMNGELLAKPYLDITDRVGSKNTEQGLLGLAFHPKYSDNGYFYVNYTDLNGNTVISRFKGAAGAVAADPASEKILLQVKQPYPNHNGGGVVFGPDGYLYLSLGDGGSGGDPQFHAQSLNTLLGKILRIDVNQGDPYAIPADNPFAKGGGLPEIWAYGLRNPWRFSFDRATGDLYIADVGQNLYEEINFVPAGSPGGLNFGWNFREGLHFYKGAPPAGMKFVDPIWEYSHDQGCSVTGGFVYRGKAAAQLQGIYIYTDYCTGKIWGLSRGMDGKWTNQVLSELGSTISGFGLDISGELYVLEHNDGKVLRLE